MKILLIILLLMTSRLYSDEMHDARQLYQAGEYDGALATFESMLREAQTPWEKSVLRYNIGCVILSSGHPFKAITVLNAISLSESTSPLLIKNIKTVLAMAYIQEAKAIQLDSLEAFSRGLFYLWEAHAAVESIEKAECQLEKSCKPSEDVNALRAEIAIAISQMYSGIKEYWTNHAQLKEGLPLLSINVYQIRKLAAIIQHERMHGKLLKDYLAYYKSNGEEWMPLWKEQEKLLVGYPKEVFELFSSAKKSFLEGLASARLEPLDASSKSLAQLLSAVLGKQPLFGQLQKLLIFYQAVLLHDPLQSSMLASLEAQYALLPEELIQPLSQAKNTLSLSYQATLKGDSRARLLLLISYRDVELLLRKYRPSSINQPQTILEDAIEDERYAIIINRQEVRLEDFTESVKAQQYAVSEVDGFYDAVKAWQDHDFHKQGTLVERCQYRPWDEVLPLFNQGLSSARKALNYNGVDALIYQEQAYDAWKEALYKMNAPQDKSDSPCKGAQKTSESHQDEPTQASSFEEVASQIIRMDEADRLPKEQVGTQPDVERPW